MNNALKIRAYSPNFKNVHNHVVKSFFGTEMERNYCVWDLLRNQKGVSVLLINHRCIQTWPFMRVSNSKIPRHLSQSVRSLNPRDCPDTACTRVKIKCQALAACVSNPLFETADSRVDITIAGSPATRTKCSKFSCRLRSRTVILSHCSLPSAIATEKFWGKKLSELRTIL